MSRHKHASTSRTRPESRPSIELDDDILDTREKFAKDYGISQRTMARKLRAQTKIIAGVAYVYRNASKRALAGLEPTPTKRPRVTA